MLTRKMPEDFKENFTALTIEMKLGNLARYLSAQKQYVTIKRGKTKLPTESKQHRYLHFKDLPHSHVKQKNGKKLITRSNV